MKTHESFLNEIEKLGGPVFYGYTDMLDLINVVNTPSRESLFIPNRAMVLNDTQPMTGIPQKVRIEIID